jgi:hypothetical protein
LIRYDPPVIYWNAADLGNFVFGGASIPNTTLPASHHITADDLRAGRMSDGLTLTQEQGSSCWRSTPSPASSR